MIRKQAKVWTTGGRTQVRICDMSDAHLLNTLRLLRRNAVLHRGRDLGAAWSAAASFQGDMATYYAEQEADEVSRKHWLDYVSEFWEPMMLDAERRGGQTWHTAQEISHDRQIHRQPFLP